MTRTKTEYWVIRRRQFLLFILVISTLGLTLGMALGIVLMAIVD